MLAPSWTLTFPDWAKSTAVVKITVAKNLTRTPSRAKTSWEYGLRSTQYTVVASHRDITVNPQVKWRNQAIALIEGF
jgi:hypothetical protein